VVMCFGQEPGSCVLPIGRQDSSLSDKWLCPDHYMKGFEEHPSPPIYVNECSVCPSEND
jgi:hypothetical protein